MIFVWVLILCCLQRYSVALNQIHNRPHIITIIADDLGWNDVGFHGSDEIPTPNIDALAYNGRILNRHYTQPTCTPSRAALMTGKYPIRYGLQGPPIFARVRVGLPLNEKILPQYLKELGYVTRLIGKWHLGYYQYEFTPLNRGFDSHFGYYNGWIRYNDSVLTVADAWGFDARDGYSRAGDKFRDKYATDVFTEEAVNVIKNHDVSEPLFLDISHVAVHACVNDILQVKNHAENDVKFSYIKDTQRRLFAGILTSLDDSVGKVIAALDEKKMLENSIVLFISDNGGATEDTNTKVSFRNSASNWPLRGWKGSVSDGGVRGVAAIWSPLINSHGDGDGDNFVSNQIIHISDWFPTLYAAAGGDVEKLGDIDGVNQWRYLTGKQNSSARKELLLNINEVTNDSALIIDDWKYIRHILPHCDQGLPATREFLLKVVDILLDYVKNVNDRNEKVLNFRHPADMMALLKLELPDKGVTLQELIEDCHTALKHQVKTGHPRFFNQLSCGLDLVSMAGEWLTATANTNMFTYEIAPVFILMESVVLSKMREIIGWEQGDSILAPGGSISNLYAFLSARHRMFPGYKEKGLNSIKGQLVMFTSCESHYSVKTCASVGGLGTDHCIEVPADDRGKMIPSELERLILENKSKGNIPFFVSATAGTTVFGAFDPIHEIADICKKYKLWLHIDAAWGGGLLFSRKYRPNRLDGIERADSVTWNPHKLMGTLLQCSTVHFKDKMVLTSCNTMSADYLFMQDKLYDVRYDTGDKVIQCGRHNDIFKLWLQWRAKGTEGFERHIDQLMELSEYMVKKIKTMPDKYYLILEPEMVNVSFWYIPKRLRSMPHTPERVKILGEITPKLKGRMMEAGTLMIGYQPQGDLPNFFRNIISSDAVRAEDIDFLLSELDRLGQDL